MFSGAQGILDALEKTVNNVDDNLVPVGEGGPNSATTTATKSPQTTPQKTASMVETQSEMLPGLRSEDEQEQKLAACPSRQAIVMSIINQSSRRWNRGSEAPKSYGSLRILIRNTAFKGILPPFAFLCCCNLNINIFYWF
jgi:hypothetical protein